ncbi:MAG TPA: ATP-binding protein [Kofleriaceae bacterium]|nr:ATP-binding protein [Kofleriaceae bacterium]
MRFFEDPLDHATHVAAFLAESLRAGGTAGAIACPSVLDAIRDGLASHAVDVVAVLSQQRLVLLDAEEQLDALMAGAMPDASRFRAAIAPLVARLRERGSPVHLYGEMVNVLTERGNSDAALQLEQLWSELAREQPFSILCGYNLRPLAGNVECLEKICEQHEGVARDTAQALAQLAERARALQTEVERRTRTEQRMHELLAVTSELAAATSRDEIARLVVEVGRAAVGAESAGVWTVAGNAKELELASASLSSEHDAMKFTRVPLDGDTPAAHVMRTGEPVFLASLHEYRAQFPESFERLRQLRDAYRAIAIVPMQAHGVTLGVMAYSYANEHTFEDSERTFQRLLARQCALAFDRARMHREERTLREAAERLASAEKQARGDVELLYELIASVNRLDGIDDVYALVMRSVMRGTRSQRAAIMLFDETGAMQFEASEQLSREFKAAVAGHTPWKREDFYPLPLAVDDCDTDAEWATLREAHRAEGIRALAVVPLINHQGQLLGQLMLYRDDAQPFTGRDLQLASTVGVHVAQAVERTRKEREISRAYREEREARLLADEATRAREEILSVVSHDLRNPLGAILMCASSLLHVSADDSSGRIRTNVERIHRQAERMARYISDLVDFAGIEAGRIRLERREHQVAEIVGAASELFGPIAAERGLKLETSILPDLPAIECDSERAVQVLTNLVANALKVTPKGGAVSIGAETKDNSVVFYVRDTGPGIEQEELPNLFERHWRSKSSNYKGAGLGLSIARGIVSAHGGKIWAESQLGAGATFYFSLSQLPTN